MKYTPLFLLILFFLVDAIGPRLGMVQVSVQVWHWGWAARVLAAACLLMLASHLLFQWPMPPAHKEVR